MTDDSQWARPAEPSGQPEPSRQTDIAARGPDARSVQAPPTPAEKPVHRQRGATVLLAAGLERRFLRGSEEVIALNGVNLELFRGEFVALVGPSGSGKTTLLNVLCGWELPDRGSVLWNGASVPMADIAWNGLSLVPQTPGLIDDLTAAENIGLPCRLRNETSDSTQTAVDEVLRALGLSDLSGRYPYEMSLGEQQRASVARALVLRPDLLLADEPTAHQDEHSMTRVLHAIRSVVESDKACVVASHNPGVLDAADRVVEMRDGQLSERS
jgi:ABC-type lipoprotein export system ATPase subunit